MSDKVLLSVVEDLGFTHYFEPAPGGRNNTRLTLLLLHGTGGDETDMIPLGRMLSSEANLISPRGKSNEEGVPRYFRRLAEGVFDEEDLLFRTKELADFLTASIRRYKLHPGKIMVVGYSNGANIGASMLLSKPEMLAGVILFRSMLPFTPSKPPDLSKKVAFMAAGAQDSITPRERVEQLSTLLERFGAKVSLHWIPNASHALTQKDTHLAKNWLEQQFPQDESS